MRKHPKIMAAALAAMLGAACGGTGSVDVVGGNADKDVPLARVPAHAPADGWEHGAVTEHNKDTEQSWEIPRGGPQE